MIRVIPRDIKDLYRLRAETLRKRPSLAWRTGHATARARAALACEVQHDDRMLRVDLPAEDGGSAVGPHPEQLMRASLAASLATSYCLWAARLDLPVAAVTVDVICCSDARGSMGLDPAVAVGWQRIVVDVTLASAAPEAELRRLVETANRLDPMLANLDPAIPRLHRLNVERA